MCIGICVGVGRGVGVSVDVGGVGSAEHDKTNYSIEFQLVFL